MSAMAIYHQPSSDVCLISPGMRDNHEGYPQLLDAYERDGLYLGAERLIIAGEVAAFELHQAGAVATSARETEQLASYPGSIL